jgi:hypothetical protein
MLLQGCKLSLWIYAKQQVPGRCPSKVAITHLNQKTHKKSESEVGVSSVITHLPSMPEALGSNLSSWGEENSLDSSFHAQETDT